ncbi:MAG: histidine kinase dimerization/phospho-acceptor domain-containing protein, partial [Solirubrobacterales bacterium]
MTFRRRIVLLAAAAVAVAIALAVTITYIIVRHDLRDSVDHALRMTQPEVVLLSKERAPGSVVPPLDEDKQTQPLDVRVRVPNAAFGDAIGVAQATLEGGTTIRGDSREILPVTEAVRAVAAGKRGPFLRDETVNGVHLRVFTRRGDNGEALQIARSLTEADETLGRLRWLLATVMLGGVGLAAALGLAVSRAATRPLARLTATAEQVTATGELHHRIPAGADDEPGRLAAAFNAMLSALESSRDAQRQLVADASHELRTPLTAIRANIELLEHAPQLAPAQRAAMLRSAREQLEDLTVLVGDLVDLARAGGSDSEIDPPEELR